MACPPHHLSSLSLTGDGWITAAAGGKNNGDDGAGSTIEITRSCRRLLDKLELVFTSDFGDDDAQDGGGGEDAVPLEELPHCPDLANAILKVIADIRRLGAPSEKELRRKEEREDDEDDNEGGQRGKSPRRRGRGRRNGKVARMEEQRRLRQQNEQQKLEEQMQQSNQTEQGEGEGETNDPHNDEEFVQVDEDSGPAPDEEISSDIVPVELRLPAVFNSLRVLISVVRPMLDHPQCQDHVVKMKNGPSIKKGGKSHRFYMISKRVYACASLGSWKEVGREYVSLLEEVEPGLSGRMSSRNGGDGGGGRGYVLDPRDWVRGVLEKAAFASPDALAERCIGLPSSNPEVASRLHVALVERFEAEHDGRQYMLQRSIDFLQDRLHAAISRKFRGVRLTV